MARLNPKPPYPPKHGTKEPSELKTPNQLFKTLKFSRTLGLLIRQHSLNRFPSVKKYFQRVNNACQNFDFMIDAKLL
jgi:hypothetical protein